jgi:hypothetical protein
MLVVFLFYRREGPESKKRGIGRQTFAPSFMRRMESGAVLRAALPIKQPAVP